MKNELENQGYEIATYTNKATGEVYTLGGIRDLEHAWNMAEFVCNRNNWNLSKFTQDVTVKLQSK